jgi:hypothetical protein
MVEVPRKSVVQIYGIPYEVDLAQCRVAMLTRLAEFRAAGKKGAGRELIAKAAGVDQATLKRFLQGKENLQAHSFVAIITKGLGLKVADVAKPVEAAV